LHVFPARWFYFNRPNFLDVVRLLGERPQQYLAKVFNLNRRFGDGLAAPMQLTTVVDV